MLQELLAGLVWITANVAYGAMVRKGQRGLRRFAAFCLGWPFTLVSFFVIKPTRRVPETDARYALQTELEEERDLLLEIRRDRDRRISQHPSSEDGTPEEDRILEEQG